MNKDMFISILESFVPNTDEIEVNNRKVQFLFDNDAFEIQIGTNENNELTIKDLINGGVYPPIEWITSKLCHIDELANEIIKNIAQTENFIHPKCSIEKNNIWTDKPNIISELVSTINTNREFTTSSKVIYLTSDAGEGKTTVINRFAYEQAVKYKEKSEKWLLIPIYLGGRPFLRFDDVFIASLVNNFHYNKLYFKSLLELIKLGVIIPAFDGFEEMILENSSGEAISAIGKLIKQLDSQGVILISTRKAFYRYQNLSIQANLLDSFREESADFTEIKISRWGKSEFVDYALKINVEEALEKYYYLEQHISKDHPIITRPVFITKVMNYLSDWDELKMFCKKMDNGLKDFMTPFIESIIDREANSKWLDRSGTNKPLLTVSEHHELLSYIATEMWVNNTEELNDQTIEFLTKLYSEDYRIPIHIADQIVNRISMHPLLINSDNMYHFDHEEFKNYYIGYGVYRKIIEKKYDELKYILDKDTINQQANHTVITLIGNRFNEAKNPLERLIDKTCIPERNSSIYWKTNIGGIIFPFLHKVSCSEFSNMIFPADITTNNLTNKTFRNCMFQSLRINDVVLANTIFSNCIINKIEIGEAINLENVSFDNCKISQLVFAKIESTEYSPIIINKKLKEIGFTIYSEDDNELKKEQQVTDSDNEIKVIEKLIRKFFKSKTIGESYLEVSLGNDYNLYVKELKHELITKSILKINPKNSHEVTLVRPIREIENGLRECEGNYKNFLDYFN